VKEDRIKKIIKLYNSIVKNVDLQASSSVQRAYGGIIRAKKGTLVEDIAKMLIVAAWEDLGGESDRLDFGKESEKLYIKDTYIEKINDNEIKKYLKANKEKFFYRSKSDVHCRIDEKPVLAVECKAYTENAMLKRILVDFTLMKEIKHWNDIDCYLLQLESQLGGDYSEIKDSNKTIGSPSTRTLLSYFDIDLNIITLLKEDRKVDKPIHKPEFFKPLKRENIIKAIKALQKSLIQHV
tara:strand:+ start:1819 stop:2532 length:714 start_codon:yes stop_codon:yes gene_type:complete